MRVNDYRLCYVDGPLMYFTDRFDTQWGDDWDDAPYEHNAGTPYEFIMGNDDNSERGHLVLAAWTDRDGMTMTPCDASGYNSRYSVKDINAGAVAWLYKDGHGGVYGGDKLRDVRAFCKRAHILFGVLE